MAWGKFRTLFAAAVTALALAPVVATPAAAAGAPSLPPGFVLRDIPVGLAAYQFTDFAWLPDDSVLALGKSGIVNWVPPNGTGTPVQIATFNVDSQGDIGLTSIALAPDYATTHHIYLNRSVSTGNGAYFQRSARFTVTLDRAGHPAGLAEEQVIFDVPGSQWYIHGVDTVIPAADGTLWYSVGDNGDAGKTNEVAFAAQDLNSPFGKILHLTADGKAVPGNPYYNAAAPDSVRSKVFASGFRNPFRFTLDPKSGLPVVGDVGWYTWEEVDVVQPGANLAWPCWEGNHQTPGYSIDPRCASVVNTPPLWEHQHGTAPAQGNSVTGGIVYSGTTYPAAYQGSYFFGDYAGQKMWTLKYDAQGKLTQAPQNPPPFSNIGGVTRISSAPNGDIVFSDLNSGLLRRLSYSTNNSAPVAVATSSTDPDTRTVAFDGSGSYDFDSDPISYAWDFGDGTTATGVKASHQYAAGAQFTATLTAQDPLGAKGTTTVAVAPGNHSPTVTLTPPGQADFAVGEPIALSATATDTEDGALPVTWTSLSRHCPDLGACHVHPGDGATGPSLTAPFTDHTDSRMEFTATVTDSAGVQASSTYVALPRQHRLTLVSTQPAALSIPSEGGVSSSMVAEGAKFDVLASTLGSDGASKFAGWQGGPATASWSITVGTGDQTLTANYVTAIDQRYAAEPALRASLGAATGPEIVDGPVHLRPYANGRLYWSAQTGVHEVGGQILADYLALGGHQKFGPPLIDETATPDGVGRYNHFAGGSSIYWTSSTGAHQIGGEIKRKWAAFGYERGLGYPTTDESVTPDGVGRFNHFSGGSSIYWTAGSGAHQIGGEIKRKWAAFGYERGMGYPTTDESVTPGGGARYNHFTKNGSIYWSGATGAHNVQGEIRNRWAALGWERSYLGLPTSDEYAISGGGFRSDFQGGYIVYTLAGGAADRHW
jgi:glucose/arabinose dehydrogenase